MRIENSIAVDATTAAEVPCEAQAASADVNASEFGAAEAARDVEKQKSNEPRPRHDRRGKRKQVKSPDPETRLRNRLPSLATNKAFRAWLKKHYPTIRNRTELTPGILAKFEEYERAMLRYDPTDGELVEFAQYVFTHGGECDGPYEFRLWASEKYRVYRKEDVSRSVMEDWREYETARLQENHNNADFEPEKELDAAEYAAGLEQWLLEEHGYFDCFPNTRFDWAALMQRRRERLAREALEAERKAAAEWEDAAEHYRQQARVEKLKALKLSRVVDLVPKLVHVGAAREEHDKEKLDLLKCWSERFDKLPRAVQTAWKAFHELDEESWELDSDVYLVTRQSPDVDANNADEVDAGLNDSKFVEFTRFNERVRRALTALDHEQERLLNPPSDAYIPHRGYALDQIEDAEEYYVLDGVIPEGLAVLYGAPKAGKSAWAQKLAVCVTSGVLFDGTNVAHGRVLYVSCDTGARRGAVKRRVCQILKQTGVTAPIDLVIVDEPVILNEATSVASLLEQNPGKFVLVVIDPLYQCVTGSLVQDAVMMEAVKGLSVIQRATGAAVLLVHHEPRNSQHLFGSMLLDAALDAQIHVERDAEVVTVKVELLKNGKPPEQPLSYRMEDGYLAPMDVTIPASRAGVQRPSPGLTRYSEILALLPENAIREAEGRKLIEHLLTGNATTRRQQWHRVLKALAEGGHIERREGMVLRQHREAP